MKIARLALCQIECHPALYPSHIAYLEEPFLPSASGPSLSSLASKGIRVDGLQALCLKEYQSWALVRLQQVFEELSRLDPIPDIVLFPEGSIPISGLSTAGTFSASHHTNILAGTHTPLRNIDSRQAYERIGVSRNRIDKLVERRVKSVLPLMVGDKTRLIEKKLLSPFEKSIVSKFSDQVPDLQSYTLKISSGDVSTLPMICSEALQQVHLPTSYDLVTVVSFDANPDQFDHFVQHQVRNQKIVAYCNDGHAGGTMLYCADDARRPNWLRDCLPKGMPPGDSIMIVDVDLDVRTVEVGTAVPRDSFRLIALRSIIPDTSQEFQTATRIEEIRRISTSEGRAQELSLLLRAGQLTPLQRIRADFLYEQEKRGLAADEWWEALAPDCVVRGISSLQRLEAALAKSCREHLLGALPSVTRKPELAQDLVSFLSTCEKLAGSGVVAFELGSTATRTPTFDRETEVEEISRFLDASGTHVLELTGLPQIGKTSVIRKALAQSGMASSETIELTATSTADYILSALMKKVGGTPEPPYGNPAEVARSTPIARALRGINVLCIEKCHLLLDHGTWRDSTLDETLRALVDTASSCGTKIIVESQRELPFEFDNPSIRTRLRIKGLDSKSGRALFDAQLRRVGLSGATVDDTSKDLIVSKLGGHPIAIAIAADVVYENGPKETVDSIRNKKGFFESFVRRLIRSLDLTDEEQTILRLFSLSRGDIPREIVSETLSLPSNTSIRNLLALGVLEVGRFGMLRVASIVREYFDPTDLPPETIAAFHRSAAIQLADASKTQGGDLAVAIEAEYHAGLAGLESQVNTRLIDGAFGTAQRLYESQKYEEAGLILQGLLRNRRQLDILRLAALVEARKNHLEAALDYAREVFEKNRADVWLLAELAKIALTQSQDYIAEQLIATARNAHVEDVAILIVEGRMALRRKDFKRAETVFARAKQLTHRNPWPFFYLGRTYIELGRLNDAVDVLFDGEQFIYDSNSRNDRALQAIKTQLGLAYLFLDDLDLARPIIEALFEEDPAKPEIIRAYAALMIKINGVSEAHKALKQLEKAKIATRRDKCQFHLLCGLFYLSIGDKDAANKEFTSAHAADRQNVFVMINQAKTLFELAEELWLDGNDAYKDFVHSCADLVRQILRFDRDNPEGKNLLAALRSKFGKDV